MILQLLPSLSCNEKAIITVYTYWEPIAVCNMRDGLSWSYWTQWPVPFVAYQLEPRNREAQNLQRRLQCMDLGVVKRSPHHLSCLTVEDLPRTSRRTLSNASCFSVSLLNRTAATSRARPAKSPKAYHSENINGDGPAKRRCARQMEAR